MGFSSLYESYSLISFSYSINSIRVIRRECASFRGFLLNGFICTPASLTEYKYIYITIMLSCRRRSIMAKWDLKKKKESYLRALWEYCMNLITHSQSSVGLTIFSLNCSTGFFFCSISIWNYFLLLLWGVLYIWLYYAFLFRFDPETGTEFLQQILLLPFLRLLRSRCKNTEKKKRKKRNFMNILNDKLRRLNMELG